ncbi:Lysine transporter (fragment) [Burkholderia cenocepacia]
MVGRGLPRADLPAQYAVGARLRRIGILVLADQGRHRDRIHRGRAADRGRRARDRASGRLAQLHDRRRAVRRRRARDDERRADRGLLVPRHRAGRHHGRRIGKPAQDDPARGEADFLADHAVLRARDLRDRPAGAVHRSEPAEERRDRHRREPVHAGVQPCGVPARGRRDEPGDPDGRAVGRQFRHLRGDADAVQPRIGRARAGHVRDAVAGRRAAQRAVRDDGRRRVVLPHVADQQPAHLSVAAEYGRHHRLHRVARHRGLPLPVPQGIPEAGLSARPAAVSREMVSVRAVVRDRDLHRDFAGPGLPGILRGAHRLDGSAVDLCVDSAVRRDLVGVSPRAQEPARALRRDGHRAVARALGRGRRRGGLAARAAALIAGGRRRGDGSRCESHGLRRASRAATRVSASVPASTAPS